MLKKIFFIGLALVFLNSFAVSETVSNSLIEPHSGKVVKISDTFLEVKDGSQILKVKISSSPWFSENHQLNKIERGDKVLFFASPDNEELDSSSENLQYDKLVDLVFLKKI